MKIALGMIALAGLANIASAQSASLSIVSPVATIDTSGGSVSISLEIFADVDFGTAIAGGEFALDGTAPVNSVASMIGASAAWGELGFQDNGYAGDADYNGMIFGQLIFPPFINPAVESMLGNGPVLLGTVTVVINSHTFGVWDWNTAAGSGDFMLEIYTDDGGAGVFTQLTADDISMGSVSVFMIPAPSSIALIGLGGLIGTRRRR
ncbi:MAG: PEP-CTERM sorting domain-containing protein [Phycisphaerales bacterium]|nr:PEP-CTERM sorting domain-containing protein [Phycisphaerales bacterium]